VLRRLKERGLITATARISQTRLRPRDWAEAWKSHFKPINIAGRLRVKPSWSRQPPRTGQKVVALDPGLSFGTGHHPTTRFCLEQIVARMNPTGGNSFLDIGTGSGILAIAAARLGYSPVRAFDNDPSAVRIARANARRNRLLDAISFAHADVASVPLPPRRRYSLVCANLSSPLLIQQRKRIASTVMPGGMLVLAGILASEFDRVERAFARLGFHRIAARTDSEWRSGAFQMEPS
jgi:ribosomal protein L11 methyltransferase